MNALTEQLIRFIELMFIAIIIVGFWVGVFYAILWVSCAEFK